jgi:predicted nucleotidyltransferase
VESEELVDALWVAARAELPSLPVIFAYLYGSQIGRRSRPDSDVDIGIAIDPASGDPERVASRVADALMAHAGVGGIEVTVLDGAPVRFLGRVLRDRVVLYSRDEPAAKVDDTRVVEILRDRVDDLAAFRIALARAVSG